MRAAALSRLVRLSLAREKITTAVSVLSVAVGVGSMLFFGALGLGVTRLLQERLFPQEASLLEVAPPKVAVSLLGGQPLDEDTVTRLAQLPGVQAAYRKMEVRLPASSRFSGDFFGAPLHVGVEISAVGVDAGLVAPDVPAGSFVDPGPGSGTSRLPVVVASRLLELYNHAFAPSRKLPQLTSDLLRGFSFPVEINRSLLSASPPATPSLSVTAELVGFSPRVPLASLAIPLEAARRINAALGADARTYSGVTLQGTSPAQLPTLARRVREMGLRVDDTEHRLAESVGNAVRLTTGVLALLGLCVCGLAALNIAYARGAAVQARERELAVMRAVGASRGEIQALVLAHAAWLGLWGGGVGALGAWLVSWALDAAVAGSLPLLGGLGTLFRWPMWVCLGAPSLGLLGALLGAWLPSRRAARIDPARVLAAGG